MPIISGSIPNFINGVSQQPFALRLASQAEEQENAYSSVVEGLTKRPNTRHVAKLLDGQYEGAYVHLINRDAFERYVVTITDGDLQVHGFDGVERTVAFPDGKAYLANTTPAEGFSCVTIADYTFIVNKAMKVEMATETFPKRPPEALVWVRQGNYSTDYRVTLNGITYTHTTPSSDGELIKTETIAEELRTKINGAAGFTCVRYGSTLHIYRSDGADFTLSTSDSFGDQAILSIKGKTQDFTNLPLKAVQGFQVEITGSPSNGFDNFFVEYDESSGNNGNGVWREVPEPGRKIALDPATMPHVLIRQADGTFTFEQADWDKCVCGDERTSPEPSFVGYSINDIFFYRNRLGFISDENVIFSRSSEFFNFWRETTTDILDTDPVDVSVSHVKVSILRHAIPFNENLLLFSDQTQFQVSASELLTPSTVSINQTTEFETSLKAKPVGSGQFVYFCTTKGGFTGVREYYLDGDTRTNNANDVTSHVPKYIKGSVYKLAASTNEDILIALTDAARNEIYVYKHYYSGQEKVQSSWSKWVFPATDRVLNAEFIESTLWLVVQRPDGVYLDRMDIDPGQRDEGLPYRVLLDRRIGGVDCTAVYDPATGTTIITLPYPETNPIQVVADGNGSGPYRPGQVIVHEVISDTQLRVRGDVSDRQFYVGRIYVMRYRLSPLLVRAEAPGGGMVANTEGRIQLRRMLINYANSGYFRVEVTPSRRATYTYVFSGRVVGSGNSPLGEIGIETGSFRFPLMANNMNIDIVIINDAPVPCRLLNADWEAQYIVRSQRMN